MPWSQVMHKFKHGQLHSGSKTGAKVKDRKQAIAIMLSEKKKAEAGETEYQPTKKKKKGVDTGPTAKFMSNFSKK